MKRKAPDRSTAVPWTITPTPTPTRETFNSVALRALIYEFSFSDPRRTNALIKRRLRRATLGPFDAERITRLRALKNLVQTEVDKRERSRFFIGTHSRYAEIADFDIGRLTALVRASGPSVTAREARWFAQFAVFVYHLL